MVLLAFPLISSLFVGAFLGKSKSVDKKIVNNWVFAISTLLSGFMYKGLNYYSIFFLIGYFLSIFINGKIRLDISKLRNPIGVFLVFLLLSSVLGFVNRFKNMGFEISSLFWLPFFSMLLVLYLNDSGFNFVIEKFNSKIVVILLFWMILYSLCNLWSMWNFGSAAEIQFAQNPDKGTTYAIWPNTAYMSITLILGYYISLNYSLLAKYRFQKYLIRAINFLILFSSAISLSRSALVLCMLIFISFLIPEMRKSWIKLKFDLVFSMCGVITGAFFSASSFIDFGSDLKQVNLQPDRWAQYSLAWRYFLDSGLTSKLFGGGWRSSGYLLSSTPGEQYSLSLTPLLLVEIGLVGFCILISAVIFRVFKTLKQDRHDAIPQLAVFVSIILIGCIANIQTNLMFYLAFL